MALCSLTSAVPFVCSRDLDFNPVTYCNQPFSMISRECWQCLCFLRYPVAKTFAADLFHADRACPLRSIRNLESVQQWPFSGSHAFISASVTDGGKSFESLGSPTSSRVYSRIDFCRDAINNPPTVDSRKDSVYLECIPLRRAVLRELLQLPRCRVNLGIPRRRRRRFGRSGWHPQTTASSIFLHCLRDSRGHNMTNVLL